MFKWIWKKKPSHSDWLTVCMSVRGWWDDGVVHIFAWLLYSHSRSLLFPPRLFVRALRTLIEAHKARRYANTMYRISSTSVPAASLSVARSHSRIDIQIFGFLQNGLMLFARIRHFSLGRDRWTVSECVMVLLAQAFAAHVCFIWCLAKHPLSLWAKAFHLVKFGFGWLGSEAPFRLRSDWYLHLWFSIHFIDMWRNPFTNSMSELLSMSQLNMLFRVR